MSASEHEDSPAAWHTQPPDRAALIRRIAVLKGQPPGAFDPETRVGVLGETIAEMMYALAVLERECSVRLPMSDLNRLHTLGELADLVRAAPKVDRED